MVGKCLQLADCKLLKDFALFYYLCWFCYRNGDILFMVYGYCVCKNPWLAIHSIIQRQFSALLADLKLKMEKLQFPVLPKRSVKQEPTLQRNG